LPSEASSGELSGQLIRVVNDWNALPQHCITCNTVNTFKKHISTALEPETNYCEWLTTLHSRHYMAQEGMTNYHNGPQRTQWTTMDRYEH